MKSGIGVIVGTGMLLAACGPAENAQGPDEMFDAAEQKMTQAFFQHIPEAATTVGLDENIVSGTSVRFMDRSIDGNRERNRALEDALASLQSIDPESLSPKERRRHALFTALFDGALAPSRVVDYGTTAGDWSFWYTPYAIVQNSGPTVEIPRTLTSLQQVNNAAEAEAYLGRLGAAAQALDGTLESFRAAVAQGAGPPDFIIEKSLAVVEAFIEAGAGENPLYVSFVDSLASAGVANADDYTDRALGIIEADVIPAYQRIADYLAEISTSAPHDAGIWRLPNGEALYAAMILHMTDTNKSADEIHELGLREVDRIALEMDSILRSEGYADGTVAERMQLLFVEPRFLYSNDAEGKAALLKDIRTDIDEMYARLPDVFLNVPDVDLAIRAIPDFSQASAPLAYYSEPAPDGSRPGVYFINLRDTAELPSWTMATLNYHEAIPGHHLDSATGVSTASTPLEQALYSNASAEGWALYAEQLAAEMGMYEGDPYGDLGRLQAELFRAARLVVDTGIHDQRWSREQAIDYMVSVTGVDEASAVSEVERYAVLPGQALGYKLGQLMILELRAEAKQVLGDTFDIREFNQQVLDAAAYPLPIIDRSVREWIGASEAKGVTGLEGDVTPD